MGILPAYKKIVNFITGTTPQDVPLFLRFTHHVSCCYRIAELRRNNL